LWVKLLKIEVRFFYDLEQEKDNLFIEG